MRLKVNGVVVRVVDRIEIEIDVARDGEDLLNGIQVRVKGGGLTVRQGSCPDAAFRLHVDRTLRLEGKDKGAAACIINDDSSPVDYELVIKGDPGAGRIACGEGDPMLPITT